MNARAHRPVRRVLAAALAVLLVLAGCGSRDAEQNDPTAEANYDNQKRNDPVPQLHDSLERTNIIEHLRRNNKPERTRYIYLLADTGGIYAYFVIKGKVTSTSAQLTPTDGIFFFTDAGVEIQWNGRWLLADEPLLIKNPTLALETAAR